jgi:hypothetical protein
MSAMSRLNGDAVTPVVALGVGSERWSGRAASTSQHDEVDTRRA